MGDESAGPADEKIRDADRSREALLSAAEGLFAEHGFDRVSLAEIATAAGLSRGAPNYFFGSKAALYEAALERVFGDREQAVREACGPLVSWSASGEGKPIRRPLSEAANGYLEFLRRRPTFLRLIQREELAGATRLQAVRRESKAIEEAFAAVRAVSRKRGLKAFDVDEAVLLFVSLTFFPLAQRSTFMASLGIDPSTADGRRRLSRLAVDQLLHLIK
jgi:TetR/AcrR family transcriptional regulator